MSITTDFEIQNAKNIRYVGAAHGVAGAGYYTVLEFHRYLQGLADDATAAGDDFMDITRDTPSDKSYDTIITLINGYNIDQTASEHLYQGSIIQGTNSAEIWDGIQVVASEGCHVEILQNGTIIANDFWNSTPSGQSTEGLNRDVPNGISARFMVKVRTADADIDGRRLICMTREWGKTYSEFKVNGTSRGINVVPLTYASDLNNQTAVATVADYDDVANLSASYNGIDVNNDGSNEFFYSKWDKGSRSINQMYERMKWLSRRGSACSLYGVGADLFRGITHEIKFANETGGSFAHSASVGWTVAGSSFKGQVLGYSGGGSQIWMQLLNGTPPVASTLLSQGAVSACMANSGSVERAISTPFCGISTGAAIIGAFGYGVEAADLGVNDKVFDLTNTQYSPPNNVTFTVGGLVSTEDYVLVGPASAGNLQVSQFALQTALTGAAETAVDCTGTLPADTPNTGTIRVQVNSGKYRKLSYTARNTATGQFTIASTDFTGDNASVSNNVFISYIDVLADATSKAFTTVYDADRTLYVRVRDGGATPIKTFETTATLGSAGGTATAVRTSDS